MTTSDNSTESTNDASHVIEIWIKYSNENTSKFIWRGEKIGSSSMEECKEYDTFSEILYVKEVWVRQEGSNNTWIAKSIQVQESIESNSYIQYSLSGAPLEFWTDGYV